MYHDTEAADIQSGCAKCKYLFWVCFDISVFAAEAQVLAEPAYMHVSFELHVSLT